MILNSFLVIRFVFFALLVYINLVILVFTSWNINATASSGMVVSGAAGFLLFNSCLLFVLVAYSLIELAMPKANTAEVKYECIWVALLIIFQTGATIAVTVSGPSMACTQAKGTWSLCASLALLVPTTWLSSIFLIGYFFTLFISATAHMSSHRGVWSKSIYSVPWFMEADSDVDTSSVKESSRNSTKVEDSPEDKTEAPDDLETASSRKSEVRRTLKPSWSQLRNVRRGVDHPFANRNGADSDSSPKSPEVTSPTVTAPLRVQTQGGRAARPDGSRFVETFRTPASSFRASNTFDYSTQYASRLKVFPAKITNQDDPIPLPRLSEWIRADTARGVNVHTLPVISP